MQTIDLNADLGEGSPHDQALIPLISSVNIACGGHAGDKHSIRHTLQLATQAKIAIGAHPSYQDRANFGRKPIHLTPQEIRSLIHRQLELILNIHPHLHHVKPHGALYNQANQNPTIATALVTAIAELQPNTILYCPPHGALITAATENHLPTCPEGFIDRRYLADGSLTPRQDPEAIIQDIDQATAQALSIATQQTVTTLTHTTIPLPAKTLCIHGDTPNALNLLTQTRTALQNTGIKITAP